MLSGDNEIKSFVKTYAEAIKNGNAALFVGAGLSQAAGYKGWRDLLCDFANELDLDADEEHDLVSLAQFYYNENCNRSNINDAITKEFSVDKGLTENHKIIARMPIKVIWTTNYDKLLERALQEQCRVVDVKKCNNHLFRPPLGCDCVLYKMHGDVENPEGAIIIKDDYERYHKTHTPFIDRLKVDLTSRMFLFLGFSFTDPNIDYILSRIKTENNKNVKQHYVLMRELKRDDYNSDADYEYAKRKYPFFLKDLTAHGVKPLVIKEYNDITDILLKVEKNVCRRNIFISGSAAEYGDFTIEQATRFIHELSGRLIREGYNIISGFGLGVGSHVIAGALKELYQMGQNGNSNRLILRPFPLGKENEILKVQYRRDMIMHAGITIFLFGNNMKTGTVENAQGVRKEFEIAKEKGCILIPVGCTGYESAELLKEVMADFSAYYPQARDEIREILKRIGRRSDIENIDSLVNDVVKVIQLLSD